jgi:hypothetical protein
MTTWRTTVQETHILASSPAWPPATARAGGGVGAHPAVRIAPRKMPWMVAARRSDPRRARCGLNGVIVWTPYDCGPSGASIVRPTLTPVVEAT